MMLKRLLAAASAAALISTGGALAQNQMLTPAGQTFPDISVSEVTTELNAVGVATELMDSEDGEPAIKAVTPGGATFFLFMRTCSGEPARCVLIQPSAYFNATGVTLSQINDFVTSRSVTSYAVLLPDNIGAVSTKIWFVGGVAKDNFLHELSAFLYDADNFISSIQPGTAAQVSFKPTRNRAAGALAGGRRPDRDDVNAVGVNAPVFLPDSLSEFAH